MNTATRLKREIQIWGAPVLSLEAAEKLADMVAIFARYRQDAADPQDVITTLGITLAALNQIAGVIAHEEGLELLEVLQRATAHQAATEGARARRLQSLGVA